MFLHFLFFQQMVLNNSDGSNIISGTGDLERKRSNKLHLQGFITLQGRQGQDSEGLVSQSGKLDLPEQKCEPVPRPWGPLPVTLRRSGVVEEASRLYEFMKDDDQSITVCLKGEERFKSYAKKRKKKMQVNTAWDEVWPEWWGCLHKAGLTDCIVNFSVWESRLTCDNPKAAGHALHPDETVNWSQLGTGSPRRVRHQTWASQGKSFPTGTDASAFLFVLEMHCSLSQCFLWLQENSTAVLYHVG